MGKNDEQISTLLKSIETKKAAIGVKPRGAWKTNAIFKYDEKNHLNLNTINQIDVCVEAVAFLLQKQTFRKQAADLLGVKLDDPTNEDYLHDFKLRASMIAWENEKRKLDALEQKLKDLRSEDAKTADAISDIMEELG